VHFGFMVWFKLRRCVLDQSWPGFKTRLSFLYTGILRGVGLFVPLLALVIIAIAVGHARERTLMLGWVLWLNMPIFLIVFTSGGRFYAPAGVSLLVAAIPLLFERDLYGRIRRYPWRAGFVVACFGLLVAGGASIEDLVLRHDALHYWAPFLDPHDSSLAFIGH